MPEVSSVTSASVNGSVPLVDRDEPLDFDTTFISTPEDVKNFSEELYRMMMEGIASNIVCEMRSSQERIKKMMREARYN